MLRSLLLLTGALVGCVSLTCEDGPEAEREILAQGTMSWGELKLNVDDVHDNGTRPPSEVARGDSGSFFYSNRTFHVDAHGADGVLANMMLELLEVPPSIAPGDYPLSKYSATTWLRHPNGDRDAEPLLGTLHVAHFDVHCNGPYSPLAFCSGAIDVVIDAPSRNGTASAAHVHLRGRTGPSEKACL